MLAAGRIGVGARASLGRARVRAMVVALVLLVSGCTPRLGPGISGQVERDVTAAPPLEMTYLGTGGWIMRYDGETVLTAPLASHPSFLAVGLRPVQSDTLAVDRLLAPYDVSRARAILVGHGHYDHLLDVPRVAMVQAPRARIVGTRTVRNLLGTWSGLMDRVDLMEPNAADQESVGRWMRYGDRVRVLPLRSDHAPHFNGLELFDGSVDRPLREPPRTAREWLTGETFAFLVDFLDDRGEVAYRIYYQDAVTAPPSGFAPEALMEQRPVDVAVFVPATFDQVDWHPEAFVANLRPRRILLGHWEDFFTPMGGESRSIMLADLGHFEHRLARVFDGEFFRPEVGTRFRFGPSDPPPSR